MADVVDQGGGTQDAPHERRAETGFAILGLRAEGERLQPGLHVVATPIGNLRDVSLRALGTLASADAVLAEDTRVTKRLLAHYGISTPLVAYHEHNAAAMRPRLLARLSEGATLALVSDAGTPLVSDPGFKLVEAAVAAGHFVTGVPGPSAVLAALVVAGLPTDRFFFEGFLPSKEAARRARLKALSLVPGTLVLFESPRRVADLLGDAAAILGDRRAAVARELTKMFEETRRGRLSDLAALYAGEPDPRGEIVVLIEGAGEAEAPDAQDVEGRLRLALASHSLKEAVAIVAAQTGEARRTVYAKALELTREDAP